LSTPFYSLPLTVICQLPCHHNDPVHVPFCTRLLYRTLYSIPLLTKRTERPQVERLRQDNSRVDPFQSNQLYPTSLFSNLRPRETRAASNRSRISRHLFSFSPLYALSPAHQFSRSEGAVERLNAFQSASVSLSPNPRATARRDRETTRFHRISCSLPLRPRNARATASREPARGHHRCPCRWGDRAA
jgi:hypothetical protein